MARSRRELILRIALPPGSGDSHVGAVIRAPPAFFMSPTSRVRSTGGSGLEVRETRRPWIPVVLGFTALEDVGVRCYTGGLQEGGPSRVE